MEKWLTPEREDAIVALYERYRTAREVAAEMGCSYQMVYRVLRRRGIKCTYGCGGERRLKEREARKLREREARKPKVRVSHCRSKYCPALMVMMREACGYTARQIADATGYKYNAVRNVLTKRGYPADQKHAHANVHAEDVDLDAIEREYLNGATTYELGDKYGVNHETISKWMRKRGVSLGRGGRPGRGAKAYAESMARVRAERFEAVSDKVEVVSSDTVHTTTVRCKWCGREFWWDPKRMWQMDVPCPHCREDALRSERELRNEQRKVAREKRNQQREAAREWRMSVPRVCKECGNPFWSENDRAVYCCDACRRKSRNRAKARRRKGRAVGYRKRMRVVVTSETYDPTITLDAVYKRFRGRCAECGCKTVRSRYYTPKWATLDHIVALNNNGTHTWDNVQLLCFDCNSKKRDLGQMRLAI